MNTKAHFLMNTTSGVYKNDRNDMKVVARDSRMATEGCAEIF